MVDSLKQLGKYLKNTSRKSDYALNRYSENFTKIERVTDILQGSSESGQTIFEMHFKTKRPDNRVSMDLVFFPAVTCDEEEA